MRRSRGEKGLLLLSTMYIEYAGRLQCAIYITQTVPGCVTCHGNHPRRTAGACWTVRTYMERGRPPASDVERRMFIYGHGQPVGYIAVPSACVFCKTSGTAP